jgi:Bacterial PH domain
MRVAADKITRPAAGPSPARWNNSAVERARFRYNISICIAGILTFIGAIPVATVGFGHGDIPGYAYPLPVILLVPLAVAVWGWRAGTDADAQGLRVRALVGSHRIAWTEVAALLPQGSRVFVRTTDGRTFRLAAVTRDDLPKLVAASGQSLARVDSAAAPANGPRDATEAAVPTPGVPARGGRHAAPDDEAALDDGASDDTATDDAESSRQTLAGQ